MSLPEWKKILILVVGLLEILIFSGTILGWTSLKLMLKNEGIYDYKCTGGSGPNNAITSAPMLASLNNSESLSSVTMATIGNNQSSVTEMSVALPPKSAPGALANISLQLNFTISTDKDDNGKLSPTQTGNGSGNSLKRTIVIPFQTATHSLNQSFIYNLLRDSSVVLRSNRSDAELSLFSDSLPRHKDGNVSTLEQFIHLYLAENLEPAVVSCVEGVRAQWMPSDSLNALIVTNAFLFACASVLNYRTTAVHPYNATKPNSTRQKTIAASKRSPSIWPSQLGHFAWVPLPSFGAFSSKSGAFALFDSSSSRGHQSIANMQTANCMAAVAGCAPAFIQNNLQLMFLFFSSPISF